MSKPNFFLVGASKAGTTSLAEGLGNHPEIFMSTPKEPDFFNNYDNAKTVPVEEINQYLNLFSQSNNSNIVGEASVSYLTSKKAAKHIHTFNSDSKILISLRNPMERITSLFEMYTRLGLKQSFEFATIEDPWLTRQCLYFNKVQRYYDTFPNEQILWINFDDLKVSWQQTFEKICAFLEVSIQDSSRPVLRNTGGIPKSQIYNVFTNRRLIKTAKKIIPTRLHNSIDAKIKSITFKKQHIPDKHKQSLREYFINDISKLDRLLDADLQTKWFN